MKQHPMQNIVIAKDGTIRFQENQIISFLLKNGGYDLNSLHEQGFKKKDWQQFNQLIGYPVSAYGSLDCVSLKVAKKADKIAKRIAKDNE